MTAREFVRRIQTKVSMLSTGDIPIKLNGKDIECVIELIENGNGYYINIKQLTKDLALTWEDVAILITIYEAGIENGDYHRYNEAEWMKEYSQDILRRFNEIRKNYKLETENELHRL